MVFQSDSGEERADLILFCYLFGLSGLGLCKLHVAFDAWATFLLFTTDATGEDTSLAK